MRLSALLYIFGALLFQGFVFSRVIHLQTLTRHCDRTPYVTEIMPSDPVNWVEAMGLDYGQLTPAGMNHCYQLGQSIRERYFDDASTFKIFNVTKRFFSLEHKFTSTAVHRTIISCQSLSMGLFPQTGPTFDGSSLSGKAALPNNFDPLPIHTQDSTNDVNLGSVKICNQLQDNLKARKQSAEWKALEAKYDADIKRAVQESGFSAYAIDLANFGTLWDLINIQKENGRLTNAWLNTNFERLRLISDDAQFNLYTRETYSYLAGGPQVNIINNGINTFLTQYGQRSRLAAAPKMEARQMSLMNQDPLDEVIATAEFPTKYKYMHWSAHDSTIISVLIALRLIDDYPQFKVNPPYGSCIAFELNERESPLAGQEKYFVRFYYKMGYNAEWRSYAFKSLGKGVGTGEALCKDSEECDISKFRTIIADAIPKDWCAECKNTQASVCAAQVLAKTKKDLETTTTSLLESQKQLQMMDSNTKMGIISMIIGFIIAFLIFACAMIIVCLLCCSGFVVIVLAISTSFVLYFRTRTPKLDPAFEMQKGLME